MRMSEAGLLDILEARLCTATSCEEIWAHAESFRPDQVFRSIKPFN